MSPRRACNVRYMSEFGDDDELEVVFSTVWRRSPHKRSGMPSSSAATVMEISFNRAMIMPAAATSRGLYHSSTDTDTGTDTTYS